jgi:hypothetical protein
MDVRQAARQLAGLIRTAQTWERQDGPDAAATLAAWAAVEQAGATVHRQSRLLAGKPRGG